MIDGSVVLKSEMYQEGDVVSDVWTTDLGGEDNSSAVLGFANYYLNQMNFTGNVIEG